MANVTFTTFVVRFNKQLPNGHQCIYPKKGNWLNIGIINKKTTKITDETLKKKCRTDLVFAIHFPFKLDRAILCFSVTHSVDVKQLAIC